MQKSKASGKSKDLLKCKETQKQKDREEESRAQFRLLVVRKIVRTESERGNKCQNNGRNCKYN